MLATTTPMQQHPTPQTRQQEQNQKALAFNLDRVHKACCYITGAYNVMKASFSSFLSVPVCLACTTTHASLHSQEREKSLSEVISVLGSKWFNRGTEVLLCYLCGSMDRSTLDRKARQAFICAFAIDLHPEQSFQDQLLMEIPPLRVCASALIAELFGQTIPQLLDPLQPPPARKGMFPAFDAAHALFASAFARYQAAFLPFIHRGLQRAAKNVMEAMLRVQSSGATALNKTDEASALCVELQVTKTVIQFHLFRAAGNQDSDLPRL